MSERPDNSQPFPESSLPQPPVISQHPGAYTFADDASGKAIAAFVLGLIGLFAWCVPLMGLPVTIVGLVLGSKALGSARRSMAIAGIVLCIVGLVCTLINAAVGAYLVAMR